MTPSIIYPISLFSFSSLFLAHSLRTIRLIIYKTNNPISIASRRIPTKFSSCIILCVTFLGNVCVRTYLFLGRYIEQILSVSLSELQRKAPSPPFLKIFLTPLAAFPSMTPVFVSSSINFLPYSLPLELAITVPSGILRYTFAGSPKYVVFNISFRYSSARYAPLSTPITLPS